MPKKQSLHILAFNIPYPANYGGVIDVFYKIVALKKMGLEIHLHCFEYGRKHNDKLNKFCKTVHYYKRKTGITNAFSATPYFVQSRFDLSLADYLISHPFPILCEGIHCSKNVLIPQLKNRKKYLRSHNIETDYYRELARKEPNFLKKIYFYSEHIKLKKYEKKAAIFDGIFSISKQDHDFFNSMSKSTHIKAFHSNQEVVSKQGRGNFALYHANLSIPENINAALFLINKVFAFTDYPLQSAGKNVCKSIVDATQTHAHISIVNNPSEQQMINLISDAHMTLLPTFQNTGIKLKLIESLFKGRFCVANHHMIENTELEAYCHLANTPQEWLNSIDMLKNKSFDSIELKKRMQIKSVFNNENEAQKIVDVIYQEI